MAHPRDTGYRARHLVVRHGGVAIEVQLRNGFQDLWAELFETVHRDTDLPARGPAMQVAVAELFSDLSSLFARREADTIRGEEALQELLGLLLAHKRTLDALQWNAPFDLRHRDR